MVRSDFQAEQERWRELRYAQDDSMDIHVPVFLGEDAAMDEPAFSLEQAPIDSRQDQQDKIMQEADAVAYIEQMELEALVELADQDPMGQEHTTPSAEQQSESPNYDDETYDSLFMEFISADDNTSQEMDLTNG
jgi:hypothetical protein